PARPPGRALRALLSAHSRGQMQKPPKAGAAAALRVVDQSIAREAREKLRERNTRLEARKVHAGAGVDPGAECDVAVGIAGEIESVRLGKLCRIAVRRADAQCDSRSRRQHDTANLHLSRRDSIAELIRAFKAQK